ncbi:hypothetical protein BSL78_24964 [Apostichopus japonicus]|uniref:Protein kinase domain-containing protein n=1 Tax=Stichopus japonicus TaxID=307972 RepID=A0A2G8JQZ9_STIJA|nr:hypothetical protein BSL78_24964 [Apostichopus japonicus]
MEATYLYLILNMAYAVTPAGVLNYRKAVNGSVLLNVCYTEESNTIHWKFQENFLIIEGHLLRSELSESLHLLQNKSLYIQPISLLNVGKYECIKNHETLLTYFLDVEVPPTLSMTVDGHSYYNNGDTLYIPYNKTINVSCYATRGRPAVNLSITLDNEEISRSDINITTTTNAILNGTTFDIITLVSLQTAGHRGNISCRCSELSYFSEQRLIVSYSTYVPPRMSLKINEFPINQSYFWVPQYELMVITCFAWNARPKVNLSWVINDRDRIYTQTNVTEGDTPLYHSKSLLDYIPTQEHETISCCGNSVTSSEYHVGVSLYTYVLPKLYITLNGERTDKKYVSAGENVTVICHADGARPTAVLSFNDRDEVVTEMPPTTNTSRRISFILIKPLKQENIICTSTQQRKGECDLKEIVTAKVTLSDESTTQPSISAFDIMNRTTTEPLSSGFGYLQWIILSIATLLPCFLFVCTYTITRKIREMPIQPSVVQLNCNLTPCRLTNHAIDLLTFVLYFTSDQIFQVFQAKAIPSTLVEAKAFLHPGLSTKKILYTKEGICKLYDFCLAEDASQIVTVKKTQMHTVSLNQFPPESFFRNEYTAESDVWSTAVVIWEILSTGEPPFPIDEQIKPGQDAETPALNWPQRYLQLRYILCTKLT